MVSDAMVRRSSLSSPPKQLNHHSTTPCSLDQLTFAASTGHQAGSGEPPGSATSVELVTSHSQPIYPLAKTTWSQVLDHKVDDNGNTKSCYTSQFSGNPGQPPSNGALPSFAHTVTPWVLLSLYRSEWPSWCIEGCMSEDGCQEKRNIYIYMYIYICTCM